MKGKEWGGVWGGGGAISDLFRGQVLLVFVFLVFSVWFSGCPGPFFWLSDASREVSGTSFLEEFRQYVDFGVGYKSMAGALLTGSDGAFSVPAGRFIKIE